MSFLADNGHAYRALVQTKPVPVGRLNDSTPATSLLQICCGVCFMNVQKCARAVIAAVNNWPTVVTVAGHRTN